MDTLLEILHFHGPFTFVDHGRGQAPWTIPERARRFQFVVRIGNAGFAEDGTF